MLAIVGVLWAATMAELVRRRMSGPAASEDVRRLVDEAGIRNAHAQATYAIRLGTTDVGSLEATVSGRRGYDQLSYSLKGRLERPWTVRLHGFAFADWDRRLERFVAEISTGSEVSRVEARQSVGPDGSIVTFEYRAGRSAEPVRSELPLAHPLRFVPGPLPLPDLGLLEGGARAGEILDPLSGRPLVWRVDSTASQTVFLAGRDRAATRHVAYVGPWEVTVLVQDDGLPLSVELPAGISIVLVDETTVGSRKGRVR